MSYLKYDQYEVQAKLLDLFDAYGLNVAVGLTHDGIAIRSQDLRVDATNLSAVVAHGDD